MPRASRQPQAVAALLNPAMVALVQASIASGYASKRGKAMVWPLLLVLPVLVLHRTTRKSLPPTVATHVSTWAGRHPDLVAGVGPRVSSTLPVLREGMRLGLRHDLFRIEGGTVHASLPSTRSAEGELRELLKSAQLVGRWTAAIDRPSTLLALLGVRV
ncbi:three component ABC system middle component [Streptomyces sp. NPDC000971]|uniref:three component ABC system middle component n=1 Tax=Streptomyces TaxID=1883 RepID=UPI00332B1421